MSDIYKQSWQDLTHLGWHSSRRGLYPRAFAPLLVLHYPAEKNAVPSSPGRDGALIAAKSTKKDETYLTPEKQRCTRANLDASLVGGVHGMLMS